MYIAFAFLNFAEVGKPVSTLIKMCMLLEKTKCKLNFHGFLPHSVLHRNGGLWRQFVLTLFSNIPTSFLCWRKEDLRLDSLWEFLWSWWMCSFGERLDGCCSFGERRQLVCMGLQTCTRTWEITLNPMEVSQKCNYVSLGCQQSS